MVLEKILTEAEIGSLPEGIAAKIESDYQSRLEAGVKAESQVRVLVLLVQLDHVLILAPEPSAGIWQHILKGNLEAELLAEL